MASALITSRTRQSGKRYVARYPLGGRAYPLVHAGSFPTKREARTRRDVVAGEVAAGRNPADLLRAMTNKPTIRTFDEWAEASRETRIDVKGTHTRLSRRTSRSSHDVRRPRSGHDHGRPGASVDHQHRPQPKLVPRYPQTLRNVLDYAGVDPSPARAKLRLRPIERDEIEPPTAADVNVMLANMLSRWHLPLRTLEQTGMRVGELEALEWRDVDSAGSRFRIRKGKTKAARRWVKVTAWLMDEIITFPDHQPEQCVFDDFKAPRLAYAMPRAVSRVASATTPRTTYVIATPASRSPKASPSPCSRRSSATPRNRSLSTPIRTSWWPVDVVPVWSGVVPGRENPRKPAWLAVT
jgi:integrase